MKRQTRLKRSVHGAALAPIGLFLGTLTVMAGVSAAMADDHADARFRGTGKADPIRVENVRRTDGPAAGQSSITFDLAWDHSWRAAWQVDEKQHGGKGTLRLESWDAAWVFVKYRKPGADRYSHAMLSTSAADHGAGARAAIEVGLTDDGKRGVGAFIYRKAAGHGPNDFKGVKLRWLSGADGVADPKAADLKVFALQMVYVPQCAFWAGDGATDHVTGQFSAGASVRSFRIESELALTLGGETAATLNNRDAAGMDPSVTDDFNVDLPRALSATFPKGFQAFYCMRHEITQQQYVDFLNTLSYAAQRQRTERQGKNKDLKGPEAPVGTFVMNPADSAGHQSGGNYRNGIKIAVSGVAEVSEAVVIQRGSFVASGNVVKPGKPAVYETDAPYVACNFLRHDDDAAFSAWAGLRPMSELEFEKACRGPLMPVPNEYAWGTDGIVGMTSAGGRYKIQNAGKPDETVVWEGESGPDATHGNVAVMRTNEPLRVGIFAAPTSDRVSSGGSYWGILDLTGNLVERPVPVGHPAGRSFAGNHGDGGEPPWPDILLGHRGGGCPYSSHAGGWSGFDGFRVSNRRVALQSKLYGGSRHVSEGFRCVRTAPAAKGE
jgi:formylglycine-generating enzyme required for sulfatase activity